jgi:hypothetical protein
MEVQSRTAIDQTIRALSKVQVGVKWVVPAASIVGASQVGARYRPIQQSSAALGFHTLKEGLPVEEGTTGKLCGKAGGAMASLVIFLLTGSEPSAGQGSPGGVSGKIVGYTERIVRKGEAYFCALGGGASAPDLSEEFQGGAEATCEDKLTDLRRERDEKAASYMAACNSYNAPCSGGLGPHNQNLTELEQADLAQKQTELNTAQGKVDAFRQDACEEEELENMQQEIAKNAAESGGDAAGNSGGGGMTPKMVDPEWKNGSDKGQILAVAVGNTSSLRFAPPALNIGSWNDLEMNVPETADFALAQAEFFYDCPGSWTSSNCNSQDSAEGEAMWQFAWRARLRRYNAPFEGLDGLLEAVAGAEAFGIAVGSVDPASLSWGSAELIGELGDAAADGDLFIH